VLWVRWRVILYSVIFVVIFVLSDLVVVCMGIDMMML